MAITLKEIIKDADFNALPSDIQDNLMELLEKVNKLRAAYGKPMIVTSGLRTMADHLRIYKQKAKREGKAFDQSKVPMKSRHLFGQAIDVSDPKKELQKWCLANVKKLEEIGLWCEDFAYTPNWLHVQIVQPKSGNRFFIP
jgi:uncharacterized protein YcbK (DUF882 family)